MLGGFADWLGSWSDKVSRGGEIGMARWMDWHWKKASGMAAGAEEEG